MPRQSLRVRWWLTAWRHPRRSRRLSRGSSSRSDCRRGPCDGGCGNRSVAEELSPGSLLDTKSRSSEEERDDSKLSVVRGECLRCGAFMLTVAAPVALDVSERCVGAMCTALPQSSEMRKNG